MEKEYCDVNVQTELFKTNKGTWNAIMTIAAIIGDDTYSNKYLVTTKEITEEKAQKEVDTFVKETMDLFEKEINIGCTLC